MRLPRFLRSASLRTRVAIAPPPAPAAVVAAFTILTSVVLANNDAAQLDRRLDSIIDASMYPDPVEDPRRGVLTTGRSESTGQVMFQRGLQLPALPLGTATVQVNGVEYRVHTITVNQHGGVLMSVGIRADSILLNRARIPLYTAVGVVTVLIAGGLGWLLAGPAIRPLRRLTEHTKRLRKGTQRVARSARRPRGRGPVRGDDRDVEPSRRRSAGHHQLLAGRAGLRRQRSARIAYPADGDARRPRHPSDPRPARRRESRSGAGPFARTAPR